MTIKNFVEVMFRNVFQFPTKNTIFRSKKGLSRKTNGIFLTLKSLELTLTLKKKYKMTHKHKLYTHCHKHTHQQIIRSKKAALQ